LPTIVSRCEVLRLRPVSLQGMVQGLSDDFDIPEYQIGLLAHVSGGRPGYALWLAQHPEALEQRKGWLDEQQRLLTTGRVGRFSFVDGLGLSGGDPDKRRQRVAEFEQMLHVWLAFWRDVLLKTASANAPLANPDREAEIETLAQRFNLPAVRAVVASLERTLSLLRTNANARLAAEVLMLDLPMLS
jgi:DNA polymerase-3 subunit delta'